MISSLIRGTMTSKNIPVQDRLILALDVPTIEQARELVELMGDTVNFYKVGLELFMSGDYFAFTDWLCERGNKVFFDLKFFDVPETVRSAVRQLRNRGAGFVTVHGNDAILRAAVEEKGDLKILAVTALTSLDQTDLEDLGFKCNVEELVLSRARRALEIGCDGVISSGLEARRLRDHLDDKFLIITPGIRPVSNTEDDQKRTVGVEEAFSNGADYIVVGRPIRNAEDPRAKAQEIQAQILRFFSSQA